MITKYQDPVLDQLLRAIPALTGRTIVNRVNLQYSGAMIGSEFLTYDVLKIYLARYIHIAGFSASTLSTLGGVTFYDFANVQVMRTENKIVYYDSVGAAPVYHYNYFSMEYVLFSRVVRNIYEHWDFLGMRISLSP